MIYFIFQFRIVQESLKHFILLLPDGLNLSIGSFSKTSEIVHDDSIISDVTKQAIINDIANLKKNTSLDSSDFSDAMDKGLTVQRTLFLPSLRSS